MIYFFMCFVPVYVFINMVLRRIFGPRRDKVTGEWRRLHNEELHGLGMRLIWGRRGGVQGPGGETGGEETAGET